jgi:Tripartite tricarboxylate transporter family receptor
MRDIVPVAGINRFPNVMEVNPSVPVKTVPEFIAYAKANPGKLNMASSGNGSTIHVSGELFKMMTGVNMIHVPYRGAAPALTDMLGGQVQVMSTTYPAGSATSGPASCGRWQSPVRRVRRFCRTSPRWVISYQAMRQAPGTASARQRTRPPRSSPSSTRRAMPDWLTPS